MSSGAATVDMHTVHCLNKPPLFSCWDKTLLIFSMLLSILDVFTDAMVAYNYLAQGQFVYFALTMVFILVPSWIITTTSFTQINGVPIWPHHGLPRERRAWETILLYVFPLAIPFRYLRAFMYGMRSQGEPRDNEVYPKLSYYRDMLWEQLDTSALRLTETFLESVPQLVLQVYVLMTAPELTSYSFVVQVLSVAVSVVSVAWAPVAYDRCKRIATLWPMKAPWLNSIFYHSSQLMVLVPRIVAITLFTSVFHWWVFVFCGVRWLLMATFFTEAWTKKSGPEIMTALVSAAVYIFTYFETTYSNANPCCRAAGFYSLTFAENALLLGLWYFFKEVSPWYETLALVGSLVSYAVGMIFMVIHYLPWGILLPHLIQQVIMRPTNAGYTPIGKDGTPEQGSDV